MAAAGTVEHFVKANKSWLKNKIVLIFVIKAMFKQDKRDSISAVQEV